MAKKHSSLTATSFTIPSGRSSEKRSWRGMIERCYDKKDRYYKNYGGRGIRVCQRWLDSFADFFADMGPKPSPKLTIDRIDNDGSYCPENCRWATQKQQANNRSNNHWLTFNGVTDTIQGWADRVGIARGVIKGRLKMGWSIERILTAPSSLTARHRAVTHCPKGHEYTPENTGIQMKDGYPTRYCRTCRHIYAHKYNTRKKLNPSKND